MIKNNNPYTIQGTIINTTNNEPLTGYYVRAFDVDCLSEDDFLGEAQTDKQGEFEIRYRKSDFVKNILESFFEGGPDLLLKLYDPDRKQIHTTPPRKGASRFESYTITVPLDGSQKPSRLLSRLDTLKPLLRESGITSSIELRQLAKDPQSLKEKGFADDDIAVLSTFASLARIFPSDVALALQDADADTPASLTGWSTEKFVKALQQADIDPDRIRLETDRFSRLKDMLAAGLDPTSITGAALDLGGAEVLTESDKAQLAELGIETLADWAALKDNVAVSKETVAMLDAHARLKSVGLLGEQAHAVFASGVSSALELGFLDLDKITALARQLNLTSEAAQALVLRARRQFEHTSDVVESTITNGNDTLPRWLYPITGKLLPCVECSTETSALSKFAYFVYLAQQTHQTVRKLEDRLHQDLLTLSPENAATPIPQIELFIGVLSRAFPRPLTHEERLPYERHLLVRSLALVPLGVDPFADQVAGRSPSIDASDLAERLRHAFTVTGFPQQPIFSEAEMSTMKTLVAEYLLLRRLTFIAMTPAEFVEAALPSLSGSERASLIDRLETAINGQLNASGPTFSEAELTAMNDAAAERISTEGKRQIDDLLAQAHLEGTVAIRDAYKRRADKTDRELYQQFLIAPDLDPCELTTRLDQAIRSLQALLDELQREAPDPVTRKKFVYLTYASWRAQRMSELYPEVGALLRDDVFTGEDGPWDRGSILFNRAVNGPALQSQLETVKQALNVARITEGGDFERSSVNVNRLARFRGTVYHDDFLEGLTVIEEVLAADEKVQQALGFIDYNDPGHALRKLQEALNDLGSMSQKVFEPSSPWNTVSNLDLQMLQPVQRKQLLQELFAELTTGQKRLFSPRNTQINITGLNPHTLELESLDDAWHRDGGFTLVSGDQSGSILRKQTTGDINHSAERTYRQVRYLDGGELENYTLEVNFALSEALPGANGESLGLGIRLSGDGETGYRLVIKQEVKITRESPTGNEFADEILEIVGIVDREPTVSIEYYLVLEKVERGGRVQELDRDFIGSDNLDNPFAGGGVGKTYTLQVRAESGRLKGALIVSPSTPPFFVEETDLGPGSFDSGTFAILATDRVAAEFTRFRFDAPVSGRFRPFYAPRRERRGQRISGEVYEQHRTNRSGMALDLNREELTRVAEKIETVGLTGVFGESPGGSSAEPRLLVFDEGEPVIELNSLDVLLERVVAAAFYLRFASIPVRIAQAHLLSGDYERALQQLHLLYDDTAVPRPNPSVRDVDHRTMYPHLDGVLVLSELYGSGRFPGQVLGRVSNDERLMRLRLGEVLLAQAEWLFRQDTADTRHQARRLYERVLALHGRTNCECSPSLGVIKAFIKADFLFGINDPIRDRIGDHGLPIDLIASLLELEEEGLVNEEVFESLVEQLRDPSRANAPFSESLELIRSTTEQAVAEAHARLGKQATIGKMAVRAADMIRAAELHLAVDQGENWLNTLFDFDTASRRSFWVRTGDSLVDQRQSRSASLPHAFRPGPTSPGGHLFHWISYNLCIPPRPIKIQQEREACVMLEHLRACRNILGYRSDLVPPLRFEALQQLARTFADLAFAAERDLLSFRDRYEQESFSLLEAEHGLRVSEATVGLESMRVDRANADVTIASLQASQANAAVDHFDRLLEEGLSTWEQKALDGAEAAVQLNFLATALSAGDSIISGFASGKPADIISGVGSGVSSLASGLAQTASAFSQHNSMLASFERREQEWTHQREQARLSAEIAKESVLQALDLAEIATQQKAIAEQNRDFAIDSVNFLSDKFLNAAMWAWMQSIVRKEYRKRLHLAIGAAFMAERALAFELQDPSLRVIRFDYFDPRQDGLLGATQLQTDLASLENIKLNSVRRKLQMSKTISLARLMPAEFQEFRDDTGRLTFRTSMDLFDNDFPGHYLRLIKNVRLTVLALIPPQEGIRATLRTSGISNVVVGPPFSESFIGKTIRRDPESVTFSAPFQDDGLFVLDYKDDLLLPFEGSGVDTLWTFELPKASNQFDFRTIADVLLTIDYTALEDVKYAAPVRTRLGGEVSGTLPFSLRLNFADEWYHLHNPTFLDEPSNYESAVAPIPRPYRFRFIVRRQDFPPNQGDFKLKELGLFFSRDADTQIQVPLKVSFTPDDDTELPEISGAITDKKGLLTTRLAGGVVSLDGGFLNLDPWRDPLGSADWRDRELKPFGEWIVEIDRSIDDPDRFPGLFDGLDPDGQHHPDLSWLRDVVLAITYSATVKR